MTVQRLVLAVASQDIVLKSTLVSVYCLSGSNYLKLRVIIGIELGIEEHAAIHG